MKVLFADTDFWKDKTSLKKSYESEVKKAFKEAHKLLPAVSEKLSFVVQDNPRACIPEVGSGAHTYNSTLIVMSFDPNLPYGEKILLKHIKPAVFHEMNHAARFAKDLWHKDMLEVCLLEGLATVFERNRADGEPLWANYPPEVKDWVKEIKESTPAQRQEYMFRHSDGRRWIGYKVGTYIVDEAIKNSGKTIEEMSVMECADILKFAGIK